MIPIKTKRLAAIMLILAIAALWLHGEEPDLWQCVTDSECVTECKEKQLTSCEIDL